MTVEDASTVQNTVPTRCTPDAPKQHRPVGAPLLSCSLLALTSTFCCQTLVRSFHPAPNTTSPRSLSPSSIASSILLRLFLLLLPLCLLPSRSLPPPLPSRHGNLRGCPFLSIAPSPRLPRVFHPPALRFVAHIDLVCSASPTSPSSA